VPARRAGAKAAQFRPTRHDVLTRSSKHVPRAGCSSRGNPGVSSPRLKLIAADRAHQARSRAARSVRSSWRRSSRRSGRGDYRDWVMTQSWGAVAALARCVPRPTVPLSSVHRSARRRVVPLILAKRNPCHRPRGSRRASSAGASFGVGERLRSLLDGCRRCGGFDDPGGRGSDDPVGSVEFHERFV
jgi:hypothetical protein